MRESFKVSAPGKLMLFSEHAVLHGKRCIVCAVDQRLNLIIQPRQDKNINIRSELGHYHTSLSQPHIDDTFRFITMAIDQHKDMLDHGFDITVESDFDATLGLGSSSAVTAATTAAIFSLAGREAQPMEIFDHSLTTVRAVQGGGSGADLAASVFGGVLLYHILPNEIVPLSNMHPITVIYSGSKMATSKVIRLVEQQRRRFPQVFESIYNAMDHCAAMAAKAINRADWPQVGKLMDINQGLMDALGVNNRLLSGIVYSMRDDPGILGAKISGSGLGDCVVGLGKAHRDLGYYTIPIEMSAKGVWID